MSDSTVETQAFPGSAPLADFQTFVQQQEEIFGPLESLASLNGNNIMTFKIGQSPDNDHQIELATYEGNDPPRKAGKQVVCVGKCLVSNALRNVAAYRPT